MIRYPIAGTAVDCEYGLQCCLHSGPPRGPASGQHHISPASTRQNELRAGAQPHQHSTRPSSVPWYSSPRTSSTLSGKLACWSGHQIPLDQSTSSHAHAHSTPTTVQDLPFGKSLSSSKTAASRLSQSWRAGGSQRKLPSSYRCSVLLMRPLASYGSCLKSGFGRGAHCCQLGGRGRVTAAKLS